LKTPDLLASCYQSPDLASPTFDSIISSNPQS
jgi:hypothetical protein